MFGLEREKGRARVFVVDDMEINRNVLEEIIRQMGCEPVSFEDGESALAELGRLWKSGGRRPELILTDISMPGMDGYELCRIVKGHEDTKSIPIIFISAYNDSGNIVEGFSHGCEDYITKPFISEEVQARVGLHLKLHAMTRELKETNRRLQVSVREQLRQMEEEKKNFLYALAGVAAQNSDVDKAELERLQGNCRTLAQGMQLSPLFEEKISDTYIDTIELAAAICDIGNVGVPAEILRKAKNERLTEGEGHTEAETLTESERKKLKSHTTTGARLLTDLQSGSDHNEFIGIAAEIVRSHHENWDGSGYPQGLAGEAIPLSARIVSLILRYCELTGQEKLNGQEALAAMKKEAGVRFDPDIYRICCKIVRQLR